MLSRAEYLFLKVQLRKLDEAVTDFEWKNPVYDQWQRFQELSAQEKDKLNFEWEEYYRQCYESPYGQYFKRASEASKLGKIGLVKEIIKEMNEKNIPYIKPPSTKDPAELKMAMDKFYEIKHKANKIKEELELYAPVYETKDKEKEKKFGTL